MTYAFAQSNLSGLEPEIEAGGLDCWGGQCDWNG